MGAVASTAAAWPLAAVAEAALFEPTRTGMPDGAIRLNSNENVYGPGPKAMAVMQSALVVANRYPFAESEVLVKRIARLHGVKVEQLVVGCGSTEILRVAAVACLGRDKQLLQASPTFEAIARYADSTGAGIVSVPLTSAFAHDLDGMLAKTSSSTGLVYVCNPNNPTASLTPRKDLETFISKLPPNCRVLIDEAYHHFVDPSAPYVSFLDRPIDDERVIVMRTFSKVYGMAGLRLGYGVASPALAKQLNSFMTRGSINAIVAQAGVAAMDDTDNVRDSIKRNADVRREFFKQAAARNLKPIDCQTNFVMMNTQHPAEELIQHFRKRNILIGRRFPAMDTCIRVSFGTPQEMVAFWNAWDSLPFAKASQG
jgi:histidinol-phosphate aminotransferase